MCPSLWQVLQLYHWLNECDASWKTISPFLSSESVLGAAEGNRLDQFRGFGVDDLDGVAQIVGDVEQVAVEARTPARWAGRRAATLRYRPSFLSSSGAIRSRELFGRQGSGLKSV